MILEDVVEDGGGVDVAAEDGVEGGDVWGFAGYLAISVIAGIALVALGYFLMR